MRRDLLLECLRQLGAKSVLELRELGSGVHGKGYLLRVETASGQEEYVLKLVRAGGLGHDYPSDRAGMLLLALDSYNALPKHVKAVDVLGRHADGSFHFLGGSKEYYLLTRKAEGTSYFSDLEAMAGKDALENADKAKIKTMAWYLAAIHSVKKTSRDLYLRRLRDVIGHGECLMGVFDTYPRGTLAQSIMTDIEKKCVDWRARLKSGYRRLSQVHGDFHPGNIWFKPNGSPADFVLLDRSRGPWGEPADDMAALAINYIFFSVKFNGRIGGAYQQAIRLFFESYIKRTGDSAVLKYIQPFFAFRGAVVANPVFYPELAGPGRKLIFNFVMNVLDSAQFDYSQASRYLSSSR